MADEKIFYGYSLDFCNDKLTNVNIDQFSNDEKLASESAGSIGAILVQTKNDKIIYKRKIEYFESREAAILAALKDLEMGADYIIQHRKFLKNQLGAIYDFIEELKAINEE